MSRSAPLAAPAVLALSFALALSSAAPASAAPAPAPAVAAPASAAPASAAPAGAASAPASAAPASAAPSARAPGESEASSRGRFAGSSTATTGLGAPTGVALLALFSAGAWAWWRRRRLPAELASASIEVVAQASLGGRARVLWLRTAGPSSSRNMVVTVTPQAVHVIDRWPDPLETAASSVEPAQIQRARRPARVRTLPPMLAPRAASAAPAAAPAPSRAAEPAEPRGPARPAPLSAPRSEKARPRWDTATHRVIEDRARHLEAAFTGESTFEGIPDDLAADLAADLPLLPDEPGAAKPPSRSSAELLARAWRRTISRQPVEALNAGTRRSSPSASELGEDGAGGSVRVPDSRAPQAYRAERPPRTARGSIGHATVSVRPPDASPSSRRPIIRTELRAKRPAGARCRLPFRRRDEEDPQ